VELYIRTTEDDPAGAPTWSAWSRFSVGDYYARGFQWKLEFTSSEQTHNVGVTTLEVEIDMPDRVEEQNGYSLGAGGETLSFSFDFYATPAVGITVHDAATGDYFVLTNKTVSGFDLQVKDSGGSGVARTIDWIAKGYGKKAA
jgi:hypothetical protein